MANICVFCSSSDDIDPIYLETAAEMGRLIGERGHTLVYGGVDIGCMREVAKAAEENGASVIGIVPLVFQSHPNRMDGSTLVRTLHDRKIEMEALSDAFICLSGGFGTSDEFMGVITTKYVGEHNNPIVIVNTRGSYNHLLAHIAQVSRKGFVIDRRRVLYEIAGTPKGAMDYINQRLST